jgi:hypothetical protein
MLTLKTSLLTSYQQTIQDQAKKAIIQAHCVPQWQLKVQLHLVAVVFNTSKQTGHGRELFFAAIDRVMQNFYNDGSSEEEEEDDSNMDSDDKGMVAEWGTTGELEEQGKYFDFSYTHTQINLKDFPVLSELNDGIFYSGSVNALLWELISLLQKNNRSMEFEFVKEMKRCIANVPSHGSEKAFIALAGWMGSKWSYSILKRIYSNNTKHVMELLCTYLGE